MLTRRPPRGWRPALALVAAAAVAACPPDVELPDPTLTAVEPALALETASVQVTIRGDRLFHVPQRRFGSGARLNSTFYAQLGGVPLADVRWVNSKELTARVPGTLPPGSHNLVVEAPNGTADLPNAFLVIAIERCSGGSDEDGDGLVDCADSDCDALVCDDGDPCTEADSCGAAATCTGTPKSCTPPSACFSGGCDAGTCGFSVLAGADCVDGDPCTTLDRCAADGTCSGTLTCAAPNECWSAQCSPDGGCLLTVNSGQPCAEGICHADGGCGPAGPWPYFPSNFDPSAVSPPATDAVVGGCSSEFSTTTDTFVGNGCGLDPTVSRAILSDGREATILAFQNLTIGNLATLTLIGQRPAILAVFGDARIDGQVLANSTAVRGGAGSTSYPVTGGHCLERAGQNPLSNRAGGGGAGYRHTGGQGGTVALAIGGAGGTADPSPGPVPLRGGCPGGAPQPMTAGLVPGRGGGALQISASGALLVSGVLSVSGGGGSGAQEARYGGCGGGSGGTLVLEADQVTFTATAKLTANGGGGGGGSGTGNDKGSSGENGATASAQPAAGGNAGSITAGAGGAGGAGSAAPAAGATGEDGTGAGGGSAGAIFVRASPGRCSASTAMLSPPGSFTNCP